MLVGWNVYIGSTAETLEFSGFIPDEEGLALAAARLAEEAERHVADAGPDGG